MATSILLLRSARHLHTGLAALRARFPEAEIVVASQLGTEGVLDRLEVAPARRILGAWKRFTPLSFMSSPAGRDAWRRRFDHVAVLWLDPAGAGYDNVNRTALTISPGGFLAITPDGAIRSQRASRVLIAEAACAARSLAALILIAALLWAPARVLRLIRS